MTSQRTLEQLEADGYIIDEWEIWQQGFCGTYACALLAAHPHLRFGGIDFDNEPGFTNLGHFVAHDDEFAYDSAGRHPLPYRGVHGDGRWYGDVGDPEDWGLPEEEEGDLEAAAAHAARHRIIDRPAQPDQADAA